MKILKATFRVVTPMFLGDAQQQSSSLRLPSVKSSLRFWWRALQWSHCLEESCGNPTKALRALHAAETHLFGAAADDDKAHGQGQFLMSFDINSDAVAPTFKKIELGHQYLLGQGLCSSEKLTRAPLDVGEFTLNFLFKPKTSQADQLSLARSVLLWGLLGGLGSRSRRGLGSIAIRSLELPDDLRDPGLNGHVPSGPGLNGLGLKVPENTDEFVEAIQRLLGNLAPALPPFTAFSGQARIDISVSSQSALNVLSKIGDEMQFYRSNGQGGMVRGKPASETFRSDHDLVFEVSNGTTQTEHPKRVIFGLPHNYRFSSTGKTVRINGTGKERDRRASPLLIHVHRFGESEYVGVHTLLPAQFLPPQDQIKMQAQRNQYVDHHVDWAVLYAYLDKFLPKFKAQGARKVIG